MSQNWKILAYVFKENHQLLWLLPRQRLILDVAGFASYEKRQSHIGIRMVQGKLAVYQICSLYNSD